MAGRLDGKVAIISGGVSGMGLAATELFVAEGARVVVADIQDEKGRALEQRFAGKVRFSLCDVREEADFVAAVVQAVDGFGGLDVMYHNAGAVGDYGGVDDISVEGWDDTQHLLLRSTMLALKVAVAPMKTRGKGSIILTSSAAPFSLGGSGPYAYSVAKAGVVAAGRYAALALGQYRIRVNTIVPGAVPTSIWSGHVGGDADMGDRLALDRERFSRMQPLPQVGEARNIADAALFLASEASDFVTGVALPVDGGLCLYRAPEATANGQRGAVQDAAAKL
ncbi:SDR family oxidoreductase [Pseudaminobacter sp. 19-2017]|uniref:SDR family oxidoreductase n=1 Tax=Pseudaminobacter soli (ex Zhang et al. 2022) TaxID=2831468 RepID=A0A942E6X6_9HYPH|nr:SDR family NAD(P)-dependent oxidoreductase [Pseudaminobacter soli]MBS3652046.1 SDR family oxidoreductase [Pseudaminobacter soli]